MTHRLFSAFIALVLGASLLSPGTQAQIITEMMDFTGNGAGNALSSPFGVAVDGQGNVFVSSNGGNVVFKITPAGVTSVIIDQTGDGAGHQLSAPHGLAVDDAGNVYVAGRGTWNAFKITPSGVITQIIDLNGDGLGNGVKSPRGIEVDSNGNVYLASESAQLGDSIFKITPAGVITEILDHTSAPFGLGRVENVALDDAGNLYIPVFGSGWVYKMTPAGVVTRIIDNTGDGVNTLTGAYDAAVDSAGNVYVAGDGGTLNSRVFKITPAGVITMVMDLTGDGAGNPLTSCRELQIDALDNVYVVAINSHNVFKLTPAGVITEIIDVNGDSPNTQSFKFPDPIAVTPSGTVYVATTGNHTLYRIEPESDWSDIGCSTVGTFGTPVLTGTGSLAAGSSGSVFLTNARHDAICLLALSLGEGATPAFGGIVKPTLPFGFEFPLATGPAGEIVLPYANLPAVPSATELVVQFFIADPAHLSGVAMSNAIKGVVP